MSRVLLRRRVGDRDLKIFPTRFYKEYFLNAMKAFDSTFEQSTFNDFKWWIVNVRDDCRVTYKGEDFSLWENSVTCFTATCSIKTQVYFFEDKYYLKFVAEAVDVFLIKETDVAKGQPTVEEFKRMKIKQEVYQCEKHEHEAEVEGKIGYALALMDGEPKIVSSADVARMLIDSIIPLKDNKSFRVDSSRNIRDMEENFHYAVTFTEETTVSPSGIKEFLEKYEIPILGFWPKKD
ncbi:hypothetical protein IW152_006038, partial [Coemansia sp. BCRC 34962]